MPKDAVAYCVPGAANVSLTYQGKKLFNKEFEMSQFGIVFGLNPSVFSDRKRAVIRCVRSLHRSFERDRSGKACSGMSAHSLFGQPQPAMTLSQFATAIGNAVRMSPVLQGAWVVAELSDVRVSGGHCYMELIEKIRPVRLWQSSGLRYGSRGSATYVRSLLPPPGEKS